MNSLLSGPGEVLPGPFLDRFYRSWEVGMRFSLRRSVRGFTLIELIIVILILALIVAIAIPNLLSARVDEAEVEIKKTLGSEFLVTRDSSETRFALEFEVGSSREFVEDGWEYREFTAKDGKHKFVLPLRPVIVMPEGPGQRVRLMLEPDYRSAPDALKSGAPVRVRSADLLQAPASPQPERPK